MNYIVQIKAFYDWLETNSLTASEIALWHCLMSMCNKTGWANEFAVAKSLLLAKSGLKKDAFYNARNKLAQLRRIDFKENGTKATKYKVIPFIESYLSVTPTRDQTSDDILSVTPTSNQTRDQTRDQTSDQNINKLNKTKLKEKINKKDSPKIEKATYAEFVSMTNDEYQSLIKDYGEEKAKRMVEVLDNYKGASGKTYKSDYRAILNWVVKRIEEDGAKGIKPKQAIPQHVNFEQRQYGKEEFDNFFSNIPKKGADV